MLVALVRYGRLCFGRHHRYVVAIVVVVVDVVVVVFVVVVVAAVADGQEQQEPFPIYVVVKIELRQNLVASFVNSSSWQT